MRRLYKIRRQADWSYQAVDLGVAMQLDCVDSERFENMQSDKGHVKLK